MKSLFRYFIDGYIAYGRGIACENYIYADFVKTTYEVLLQHWLVESNVETILLFFMCAYCIIHVYSFFFIYSFGYLFAHLLLYLLTEIVVYNLLYLLIYLLGYLFSYLCSFIFVDLLFIYYFIYNK